MSRKRMRAPHGPLSGHQLFPTLIGAGGAAMLLAANDATAAPAKPPNACQLVAGGVSPNGSCNLFAKRSEAGLKPHSLCR
jgi:hypothetical protein